MDLDPQDIGHLSVAARCSDFSLRSFSSTVFLTPTEKYIKNCIHLSTYRNGRLLRKEIKII